jgi:hypothetical protein
MLDWVREAMQARGARQGDRIQRLWGGYGEVVRVELDGGLVPSVVVKRIAPPPAEADTISDARKRRSYAIEEVFYRQYAPRCDAHCRVARMFASKHDAGAWWFVLEDLDAAGFSERRDPATGRALEACLAWLAAFHARFLGDAAEGLWPEGTYWHLATRLDELAIDPARAHGLDRALSSARFQTLLHGDAKEANFCFTRDERTVAAVDFQYVGRGCGMKDVAYLLHGHADRHLDTYFRQLRAALGDLVAVDELEHEWRALFPIAQQDFQRFLAGWRR